MVLFHGTTEGCARRIMAEGVRLSESKVWTDFGPGFYACTYRPQAAAWATSRALRSNTPERPAVLAFQVSRDELATLESLVFVRAALDAGDYWNFVAACRSGLGHHGRTGTSAFYDVVFGPVVADNYLRRKTHLTFDQVSFHTERAVQTLTSQRFSIL